MTNWFKNNRCINFTMLSSMHNVLIRQFENYHIALEIWNQLSVAFEKTFATRICHLNMKFQLTQGPETYDGQTSSCYGWHDSRPKGSKCGAHRWATSIGRDSITVWLGVVPAWNSSWLTHSKNVKTFTDISQHLKLEVERQKVNHSYMHMVYAKRWPKCGPKRNIKLVGKKKKD